MMLLPYLTVYD